MAGMTRAHSRPRALVGAALTFVLVASGLVATSIVTETTASAADGTYFNPGMIISDADFYNSSSMSVAQIQAFLNSKVSTCRSGYTCLKDYTETTTTRAATVHCGTYTGVANQSAASIIYSVATACGINPQVLLVMLQKEQGLITDTWPVSTQYQIAMGFGCPDTAPCNTEYYGFSNQVYRAARQFKSYRTYPEDWTYRAGVVNTIAYNPNASCGATNVYIENQATAGLYNYTPYVPNGAALANMYGVGNSCSSYGNRNFWAYFADWFGFQGGSALARSEGDPTIYITTDTGKYAVRTGQLFASLQAMGTYRTVPQSYLDALPAVRDATNVLRDTSSGSIYVASDGVKNPFPSCALVAAYYGTCYSFIDLPASQLGGFVVGSPLTQFVKSKETGVVYFIDGGQKRALYDTSVAASLANGASTATVTLRQSILDGIPSGTDILRPGLLVKAPSSSDLYLTDGPTTAIKLPSAGLAESFGLAVTQVSDATVAGLTVATAPLSIAVTCSSTTYVAGGGKLWPVADVGGLVPTVLAAPTCAALPKSSQSVANALFLRLDSNGYIYSVVGGQKQFMTSMAQVYAINGPATPVWVPTNQATLDSIPTKVETLAPTELAKSNIDPTIYIVTSASTKAAVPSFALLSEFGLSTYSIRSDETLARYTTDAAPLSVAVQCGPLTYLAGGGRLWQVPSAGGLPVTMLDTAACAALPKSPQTVTAALFLRVASSGSIYAIADGKKQFMTSMAQVYALNGSTSPVWVPTNQTVLDAIPSKPETLTPGSLVKNATEPTIYMIDGTATKIPVPSFALMAEFGISGYSTKTNESLAPFTSATAALTVAVICSGSPFVAGGGMLWPVAAAGGLPTTALDPATCALIPKSSQSVTGALFFRVASTGYIYAIVGGKKQFMSSMAQVYSVNGSTTAVWIPTNQTVLDSIPSS